MLKKIDGRTRTNYNLILGISLSPRKNGAETGSTQELCQELPGLSKPGILFFDIFSLLRDPKSFKELNDIMVGYIKKNIPAVEVIVGLESRGFIFGASIAIDLQLPFVPIRKRGKLPGELVTVEYSKEYGSDVFEIQKESLKLGQKVLVVDDLLATGGSLAAACELLEKVGATILGSLIIMEIPDLNGRAKIKEPVYTLMKF